jgi:dTDP-4-amino-4,6-dideoxygalactose transaminase
VPQAVPFLDLRSQYANLRDEILPILDEVAESASFILGPHVAAFERAFADFTGSRHCIAVNSGTSALHLALIAAGVRPGDEVITTPMTFVATAWAISYVGATPVFVDVDPVTYTLDPSLVARRITAKTRALLPVHLYGQPAEMDPLMEISQRYGIPLIEDAAQAHAAGYYGKRAGSFGLSGCFSFYPGKNLGAYGEGGAIVTDSDDIAARLRALRDHAQRQRYHHVEVGFNYRMDGFQGAVLHIKLKYLEDWTDARSALASRYQELLADLPLQLPVELPGRRHAWHLFVLLHPERDRICHELAARGIQTGLHYPRPVHLQECYRHLGYQEGSYPVAERIARECFSLPMFPEMTEEQQDRVCDALHALFAETRR